MAAPSCPHTAWHQGQEEGCAGDVTGRCFQQRKGLQLHPCISQARVLFCNKALNNKPLVSIVDSCSPNLSQILLVASPVLRQISEPHLELLIEQSSKLWPKSRRILLFQRHTEIYRADRGTHTVEQAYGTLIQAEVRLKDPNLGTYHQFSTAISSSRQCKTPTFTSPSLYLLVLITDISQKPPVFFWTLQQCKISTALYVMTMLLLLLQIFLRKNLTKLYQ